MFIATCTMTQDEFLESVVSNRSGKRGVVKLFEPTLEGFKEVDQSKFLDSQGVTDKTYSAVTRCITRLNKEGWDENIEYTHVVFVHAHSSVEVTFHSVEG